MTAKSVPRHIGYILDGNRRWARQHGLPTYEGHLAGYNAIHDIAQASFRAGIEYVSIYSFSTENWKRTEEEVKGLMKIILRLLTDDIKVFKKEGIRVRVLGSREGLSQRILEAAEDAEARTAGLTNGTVALCLNYGGQLEIADAVKQIIAAGTPPEKVCPELIATHLYAPDIPPLDLIVRTSGEQRLSNFMLWRAAYSELVFVDKMWPEMTKDDLTAILEEYAQRGRRFGG